MRCFRGRAGRSAVGALLLATLALILAAPVAAQATVSVGDAQVTETNGNVAATFTITRQAPAFAPAISTGFQTADGSAGAADYVPTSGTRSFDGTLLFAATQTQTVTVTVKGDTLDETTESFRLELSGPEVSDGEGIGTIVDDDPSPAIGVQDAPDRIEGSASATAPFAIRLSAVSGRDVAVSYNTADGTATAGQDYVARSGSVTIPAGATGATVEVTIRDDSADEPAETFELHLHDPSGATLGDAVATATIIDDDDTPATGSSGTLSGGTRLGLFGLGVKHKKTVSLKVSCPSPAGRCAGRVTLFTRPNPTSKFRALRTERRLGRKQFNVAGGNARTLRMTLHRADRRLLLRAGRLRVRAFAVVEDASGHAATRTLLGTIRARKRKKA
jgi:Calx-beta domain